MLERATHLDAGNPLELALPSRPRNRGDGPEWNWGMVKMCKIGQSAALLPKSDYGEDMGGVQRLNGCGWLLKS